VKTLSPKQRVLKKYPNAYIAQGSGFYAGMFAVRDTVIRNNIYSDHCHTPVGAWAAAARELSSG
jgi:hypothetical protein